MWIALPFHADELATNVRPAMDVVSRGQGPGGCPLTAPRLDLLRPKLNPLLMLRVQPGDVRDDVVPRGQ